MTRQKWMIWMSAVALVAMTAACSRSDPGITTAVKSKLAADDTVKAYRIDVDTKDRIVTLKGEVDTEAGKARAIDIARTTEGVRDVVDDLKVAQGATPTTGIDDPLQKRAGEAADKTANMMSDASITASVKTKMLADTAVSGLKIDVDTKEGVVSLSGNVSSAAEKQRAVEIARETDGVKSVKDQLKIVVK